MKKSALLFFILCVGCAVNAHGFDGDEIQIHGFISQGYLKSSEHDFWFTSTESGTFQFNEIGLTIMTEPVESLHLGMQLLSRDLGTIGNNKVEVDWAYGDYRFRNWLGIRAGLLKRPYGLHNQSRDIDAARTGVFLPMSVYVDVTREYYLATQGVGAYGLLPGGFSYEFQYGTIPLDTEDGVLKQAEFFIGEKALDVENDYVAAFQLRWETPLDGLLLAFSVFDVMDTNVSTNIGIMNLDKYESYVGSISYDVGNFSFAAEYRNEPIKISLNDSIVLMDMTTEGYYASCEYQFTDWFRLGATYFVINDDKDDRDGERYKQRGQPPSRAWRKGVTLSTRFDINDKWTFKLEGHSINGLNGVYDLTEKDPSADWFLFAAKTTFIF